MSQPKTNPPSLNELVRAQPNESLIAVNAEHPIKNVIGVAPGGTSLRLCEGRDDVRIGLSNDSCRTGDCARGPS